MRIHIVRLSTLTLIAVLSLAGFAAHARAQAYPFKRLNGSPKLGAKGKPHKAKIAAGSGFSTLYNFCSQPSCTDGSTSYAGLISDSAGNLYGTTSQGGANTGANGGLGGGTVFELNNTGQETVLYSFCSAAKCVDGEASVAGLIQDAEGNLYGTTSEGGSSNGGTVFKLEPPAQQGGAWTEVVLYNFCSLKGCVDGTNPVAGLIQDASGNLYGTTYAGGPHGWGAVFEVNSSGVETVLYSFRQPSTGDGNTPVAGLIQDVSGNLYGTTSQGGANNAGTAFEVTPAGVETVLYSFCSAGGANCTDGQNPLGGLIADDKGNLYGTTNLGGEYGYGAVFELTPAGAESVLYNFCSAGGNCTDGAYPAAGLVQDAAGNLYSTTESGGTGSLGCIVDSLQSCGTTFRLAPPAQQGGTWTETVLYSFCSAGGTACTDGAYPEAGLIQDSAGNLYSTTSAGGANEAGTVFKVVSGAELTPTVTLTSTPNPSYVDQSVTLSVVVSGSGPTPTGSVTFQEGQTTLGTVTLANGQGSLVTIFAAAGSFSIVASYSGDSNYKAGNSSPITQVVNQYTTSTALASSLNPSTYGQAVTFTATVASAGPTPTGTVTFLNGKNTLGSATLSGGVAQITTSKLGVGTQKITAAYGGDAADIGSTSPILKQVVKKASSTTSVASSLNPSNVGQKVTFTATVTSPTATPTGTVKFMDGSTELGTGTLKKGKATYSTSSLSEGSHNITAVYAGTADITGSTSPVLVQVVN